MPFVSNERWDQIVADNMEMAGELEHYRAISGVMGLAVILQQEIADRLENPSMTPSQIGDEAYRAVLENSLENARRHLITEYEEQHRAELYGRVVEEVRATEGNGIMELVRQRFETDPELALELRESARRELSARAIDVVRGVITAEEQEIIDTEADRQIELDRLDVEFAVDGELDLHRDDIIELVKPGDQLILTYSGTNNEPARLTITWTSDAKGQEGWAFESSQERLCKSDGNPANINANKFLVPASEQYDMKEGEELTIPNVLKKGAPLILCRENDRGVMKAIDARTKATHYDNWNMKQLVLLGIDFRTRAIVFNEQ